MGVWSALRCRSTWSALGPHGIGDRWSSAGTSGHGGQEEAAGHRAFPRQPRQLSGAEAASNPTSPDAEHPAPTLIRASGRFQEEGPLGTTMPVTRDSPSIQGDVPGPDPARAPPNKAIAMAGLACRGSRRWSALPRQGPRCGAPLPPRAACLVHVWSTRHRSRAVRNGLQWSPAVSGGASVAQVAGLFLGEQAVGQNPDKDALATVTGLHARVGLFGRPCPRVSRRRRE
jgi:hypothetical protein